MCPKARKASAAQEAAGEAGEAASGAGVDEPTVRRGVPIPEPVGS
jgi:hypothetical protein